MDALSFLEFLVLSPHSTLQIGSVRFMSAVKVCRHRMETVYYVHPHVTAMLISGGFSSCNTMFTV